MVNNKMELIKFEDWAKLNFVVAEVESVSKSLIKIRVSNQTFSTSLKLDMHKGDKIVVLLIEDKLVVPLANNISISPEKDIENGARVS